MHEVVHEVNHVLREFNLPFAQRKTTLGCHALSENKQPSSYSTMCTKSECLFIVLMPYMCWRTQAVVAIHTSIVPTVELRSFNESNGMHSAISHQGLCHCTQHSLEPLIYFANPNQYNYCEIQYSCL
jgi:hypothetical protein